MITIYSTITKINTQFNHRSRSRCVTYCCDNVKLSVLRFCVLQCVGGYMQVHVCVTVCVHAQVISMLVFPTYSHTHILLTQLTCCSKQYTLPSPQSLSPASSSPATPTKSAKFATMPPLSPVTHGKTDTSPSRELQRWRTAAKRDCYIDINMLTAIQLARQVGWLVVCVCVCVCVCEGWDMGLGY